MPGLALFLTDQMCKRLTDNIITGNDPHLGLNFYYSPHFKQNILRQASSLTGERTRKDPAFKGFRQSINRMKEASPIAASLYKQIPEHVKKYALYRTLTGEAIKMLKEGMESAVITETLREKYIDTCLNAPDKSPNKNDEESLTKDSIKGMKDFTVFPSTPTGVRKITRRHRSLLLQKITQGQTVVNDFLSTGSDTIQHTDPIPETNSNISEVSSNEPIATAVPERSTKTTDGLIYLGRLPECKKLKMWLRPLD